jgi:hypothetical protein
MKLSKILVASLLALTVAGAGSARAIQEGEEQVQEGGDDVKTANIRLRKDMERLFHAYGWAHGGRAKLRSIRSLSFRWIPHEVLEDGTAREREPMMVTLQLEEQGERLARIDEEIEGRQRTKIVNDLQNSVRLWIDGEERQIPEILGEAQQEAKLVFMLLDLLYRPEGSDIKAVFEGRKRRDGTDYLVAYYEFHDSRQLPETFRCFYHAETGLVGRIDMHDKSTPDMRRISTLHLTEYIAVDDENPSQAVKFPGRVEWKDRNDVALALWRFTDVELNPDLLPGWFSSP